MDRCPTEVIEKDGGFVTVIRRSAGVAHYLLRLCPKRCYGLSQLWSLQFAPRCGMSRARVLGVGSDKRHQRRQAIAVMHALSGDGEAA